MATSNVLRFNANGYAELPIDWNGPTTRPFVNFSHEDLNRPIADLFEDVVRRNPSKIALDDGEVRLSYGDLWPLVRQLGSQIQASTSPEDLVGILLPTSAWCEIAILSCFLAGRPFAPLDLHYPRQWTVDVIGRAAMKAVIGRFDHETTSELIPASVVCIDVSVATTENSAGAEARFSPLDSDAPAILLFTSGSTGHAKGIVNSQRALLRRVEQYVNAGHITEHDRFLPLSSACTIAGMRERLTALLRGATLHLVDVQRAGVQRTLDILHGSGITIMWCLPSLARSLAKADAGGSPSDLRLVRVGGEAVLWNDLNEIRKWLPGGCLIQISYGSSEAPVMQWFVPANFPQGGAKVPIGYPLPGNQIAVLDDEGHSVPRGEVGELVVTSPYVALGLWMNGKCNGEQFPTSTADLACRVHRSRDLVRLRSDGLFDIVGRKDRQIKIQGQRVEPAELEAALLRFPDVLEAAALARTVEGSVSLVAYVVLRLESSTSVSALRKALKEILPAPLRPARIVAIASIPHLPSGKLDLLALQAFDRERQDDEVDADLAVPGVASDPGATTVSAAEAAISKIWSALLGKSCIGPHQDFFELGGDSLKALRLMFEIEKKLKVQLPLTAIHQFPTIAALAAAVEERTESAFSPLVLIKEGSGPPLFMVHGVGGTVMELFPLGRMIDWPGRVYAIQAQGLDGRPPVNHTIEAVAESYLQAIRELQPYGPYYLLGYSYGGLVAFEMARRLRVTRELVGFLGLLDSATSPRQWPMRAWASQMYARFRRHPAKIWRLSGKERIHYVRRVLASFRLQLRRRLARVAPTIAFDQARQLPPALRDVGQNMSRALENYRLPFYEGPITVFKSTVRDASKRCDPYLIWRGHARQIEFIPIPGDHKTMIKGENCRRLAHAISECLAKSRQASIQLQTEPTESEVLFESEIVKRPAGVA